MEGQKPYLIYCRELTRGKEFGYMTNLGHDVADFMLIDEPEHKGHKRAAVFVIGEVTDEEHERLFAIAGPMSTYVVQVIAWRPPGVSS